MSVLREAGWHLGVRAASALASSGLFALLARANSPADAKTVFFFMFASGFLAAFLRSFCMLVADLRGDQRRSAKLRRVHVVARRFVALAPLFLVFCTILLSAQEVGAWLVLAGAVIIVSAGFDSDLLRAALGLSPRYSTGFAIGSGISLGLMWLSGTHGVAMGALAALGPWVMIGMINLSVWWRVLRRLSRKTTVTAKEDRGNHWPAALLTALYDGVVLNLPFFGADGLGAVPGFDLSVTLRLFSSAQPFFPLVTHWANSGRLTLIAKRFTAPVSIVFGVLLAGSALLASVIFVLVFSLIGGKPVTAAQYIMFSLLLLGYTLFATVARFFSGRLSPRLRARLVGTLLTAFIAIWYSQSRWLAHSAALIIALQTSFLVCLALCSLMLVRLNADVLRPDK